MHTATTATADATNNALEALVITSFGLFTLAAIVQFIAGFAV